MQQSNSQAQTYKNDFPIFKNNPGLVYLDSSATSQKPLSVIEAVKEFYEGYNTNIHRGIYELSEIATKRYEESRKKVAEFIKAPKAENIIFTSGVTDSINLVAFGFVARNIKKGDVIVTVESEHHSNLVTWQEVAKVTGATLEVVRVEDGEIDMGDLKSKISGQTKFVAVAHASNVLGTIHPIDEIVRLAHGVGANILVDCAATASHLPIRVGEIDFLVFSGHKMLAPTGTGVLYGKTELLEQMSPVRFGGGMIKEVQTKSATWAQIPDRFEAGTPNIAGVIGLGAAIDYINSIGVEEIAKHDTEIASYAIKKLKEIDGVKILGPAKAEKRVGLVTFVVDGIHAHDIAAVLAEKNIAVRAGHHCAMPIHTKLKIPASVRASFHIYNTFEDIDELIKGLREAINLLS